MKNTHRTNEGETMFISEMETSHLENTIKMYLKKIKECNDVFNNVSITNNIDYLIAGIDNQSMKDTAKNILRQAHAELGKYLVEAFIRGLDLSKDFQETFGRKDKSMSIGVFTKSLLAKNKRNGEFYFELTAGEDE